MSAAILSIGTELTRGELVNTNAAYLATELTRLGFEVTTIDAVADAIDTIVAALHRLAAETRVVVVTGGLGPTSDDLTAAAAAKAAGVSLVRHEPTLEALRRRMERLGRAMSPAVEKQADVPEGAEILPNDAGTAPGFALFVGESRVFFMPGVPREMRAIFEAHIAGRLRAIGVVDSHQIRVRTFGLPEAVVAGRLEGLEAQHPGLTLGYRASFPEVEVKVLVKAAAEDAARKLARQIADEVYSRLGEVVYGEDAETFANAVAKAVRARSWKLALAESCTGGLASHMLTEVPVSDLFLGGAVVYANSAKTKLLGVEESTLRGHGAVSQEVVAEMAAGVRLATGADVALAVTGIAGPSGGTPEKPVGLVHWAVAHPGGLALREAVLSGDRAMIQRLAAYRGLALVREIALMDERRSGLVRVPPEQGP